MHELIFLFVLYEGTNDAPFKASMIFPSPIEKKVGHTLWRYCVVVVTKATKVYYAPRWLRY